MQHAKAERFAGRGGQPPVEAGRVLGKFGTPNHRASRCAASDVSVRLIAIPAASVLLHSHERRKRTIHWRENWGGVFPFWLKSSDRPIPPQFFTAHQWAFYRSALRDGFPNRKTRFFVFSGSSESIGFVSSCGIRCGRVAAVVKSRRFGAIPSVAPPIGGQERW